MYVCTTKSTPHSTAAQSWCGLLPVKNLKTTAVVYTLPGPFRKGHKANKSTTKTAKSEKGHINSFILTARHSQLNARLNRHKQSTEFLRKHCPLRWSSPHRANKEPSSRSMAQPGTGETTPHRHHTHSPPGSTSTTTVAPSPRHPLPSRLHFYYYKSHKFGDRRTLPTERFTTILP